MIFHPKSLLIHLFSSAPVADSATGRQTTTEPGAAPPRPGPCRHTPEKSITLVSDGCMDCNKCVKKCLFLERHGTPGQICRQHHSEPNRQTPVFGCTLCGLCETVCPQYLPITTAFLDIRRMVQQRTSDIPATRSVDRRHNRICTYEKIGTSRALSLFHLPEGGDTVFFPGCTLAATRPETALKTFEHLQKIDSRCGIVLDCCTKPSHDLGLTDRFEQSFSRLARTFRQNGVEHIITACPSCHVTLKKYLPECQTRTVYEVLAENPPSLPGAIDENVVIHDTCTSRGESQIHHSVRTLVTGTGAKIRETEHGRGTALCCGEGAAAAYIAPDLSAQWQTMRKNEAADRRVITYCAGCTSTLAKRLSTTHLLDLLFATEQALSGGEKQARPLIATVRRLLLKWKIISRRRLARVSGVRK